MPASHHNEHSKSTTSTERAQRAQKEQHEPGNCALVKKLNLVSLCVWVVIVTLYSLNQRASVPAPVRISPDPLFILLRLYVDGRRAGFYGLLRVYVCSLGKQMNPVQSFSSLPSPRTMDALEPNRQDDVKRKEDA